MTTIFADEAPKFWEASLPAIPLLPGQKRPAVNGWQKFADAKPTDEEKAAWLKTFPNGNIGLPMGAASGLVAVDIDSEDPKVIQLLERVLPPSPWERVGKKGMVKIYRFTGQRTTRIQSPDAMICEILSKGTQIVLPPSIHPETKAPYRANRALYDIRPQEIPTLPPGIEDLIRDALKMEGIEVGTHAGHKVSNFVPAGQRDNTMIWHAGLLARTVTRGERSLLEALGEMGHWVNNYVEKVVGDPLSVEKAQQKVVEFVIRDVTGVRRMGLPIGWDEGLSDQDKEKLGLKFTENDEKWSCSRILTYLGQEFTRFPDATSEGQQAAVAVAMDRVARSEGEISALDEERIVKFIASQSNGLVTTGALKKHVKDLRKGDIEGENHDEIAREVHKFISQYGELRFHAGNFWQWKGSHWEVKPEDQILKIISNEFGFYPSCKRTSDYTGVLKLLRSTAAKELQMLNMKGVNFANGFLTERLDLVPHHEDFGCTYVLPYRYLPEEAGRMPMFNKFMMDSWSGDADFEDKMSAIQEAMGATLFGVAPKFQKVVCLFGQAGSGKSVMSQIVRSLLPKSSVSSVPPQDWGDKFLPAQMFGKVLNFAGELSENKQIAGEVFKQIVEGEEITAQHKNMQPFQFRPYCAQWFNSNHLPKTKDTSAGFNRRWLFIKWSRPVPKDKQIPDLANIIVDAEREAIAAWAVQGLARLTENKYYTEPSSHLSLVDQMATDNNTVRYFLASSPLVIVGKTKVEGRPQTEITSNDLYDEYWQFCLATGTAKRASSSAFVRMMRELASTFDFKVATKPNRIGSQEIVFEGITRVVG